MNPEPANDDYLDRFLSSAFAGTDSAVGWADPERDDEADLPDRIGRFQVVERIGHGGIGIVYRVEDPDLGRDVAVKVLRAAHADDPRFVERFRCEARLCGRLTHPGVVTIHEVGELDGGQPYFAMKLVDGETLAAQLARRDPLASRHEFVDVFEKLCQAVAYAHERGVVHGDLKPQNVMVGAFGEVQVMDWGFARASDDAPGDANEQLRGGGTPAYMAPEQSRIGSRIVDARTDVFGLGAVLCEILTGAPPYLGETREEVALRAARAWQDDVIARLDAVGGAERELVALAKHCLSPAAADRPEHAGKVAAEVARIRGARQDQARRLEIEAAEARASAHQERRARRLTLALSVTVLLTAILLAIGWFLGEREKNARADEVREAVDSAFADAATARASARNGGEDEVAHWHDAVAAARGAFAFASSRGAPAGLAHEVGERLRAIELESEHSIAARRLVHALEEVRPHLGDDRSPAELDRAYLAAFADAGLDLSGPTEITAQWIRDKRDANAIVGALDQWSQFRRRSGIASWTEIDAIAAAADRDPWRSQLRDAYRAGDRSTLRRFARELDTRQRDAASLDLLASCLRSLGDHEEAVDVFRAAVRAYPDDYQLCHNLAAQLETVAEPPREEILRLCWIGVALRPRSAHALTDLGRALLESGDGRQALEFLERALVLEPDEPRASLLQGVALVQLDRQFESIEPYARAARGGIDAAWLAFGVSASWFDRLDDSVVALRHFVRVQPDDPLGWFHLGRVLCMKGETDEGVAVLERQIERFPGSVPEAHVNLAMIRSDAGRFEEALAHVERAIAAAKAHGGRGLPDFEARAEFLRMLVAVAPRLPDIAPDALPSDPAECLALGLAAARSGRDRLAVELLRSGLEATLDRATPDRGDVGASVHFDAARAAARLAMAEQVDGVALDASIRTDARQLAVEWAEAWLETTIRAVFDLANVVDPQTMPDRGGLLLTIWRHDADVRRFSEHLQQTPDAEPLRERWAAIRTEIDRVLAEIWSPGD